MRDRSCGRSGGVLIDENTKHDRARNSTGLWRSPPRSIRSQVCHLDDLIDTRVILHGPPLTLSAAPTQFIGMALHELATNAVKYGALSNGQGTVNISWDKVRDGGTTRFIMRWQEAGGPAVIRPQKEGFGHSLIVRLLEHGVGGKVSLTYPPEGIDWKISAPAVAVLQSGKGA
jgi:two-component sensor histidine kinase